MIKILVLLCSVSMLASCSSILGKKKSGWLSDDTAKIDRTKELFACSRFFNIVASQRPQDAKKYNDLAKQSKDYAYIVMPSYTEGSNEIKSELSKKYTNYGKYKSHSWVKEIGTDKTGQRFPEITKNCYKTVQRESLFNTVDDLSDKLNTNSK